MMELLLEIILTILECSSVCCTRTFWVIVLILVIVAVVYFGGFY